MRRLLILLAVAALAFAVPMAGVQPSYSFFEIAGSDDQGTRDGQGPEAQFTSANGIARDSAGNFYVADTDAFTVRKITPAGLVSTFAGTAGQPGSVDANGAAARFIGPRSVAVDASNNVYVTDAAVVGTVSNYHVRRITPGGDVSTVGTSQIRSFSDSPLAIAIDDRDGRIYVANSGYHIVERFVSGSVSAFAGTSGSTGTDDGSGAAARFDRPTGIAVDAAGRVYVSDSNNHTIRRITPEGLVSTWLGVAGDRGPGQLWPASAIDTSLHYELFNGTDGPAADARFNWPEALSLDRATGRLLSVGYTTTRLLCCSSLPVHSRDQLRVIAADGTVTTIWGDHTQNSEPRLDGVVWAGGDAMVTAMNMVFSVGAEAPLTEFAGRSEGCTRRYPLDGSRHAARFCQITSLALDGSGGIYVADAGNYTVRRVAPGGAVTTVAGSTGFYGSTNGPAASAWFGNSTATYPNGMGLAWNGYGVFVADTANSALRAIRNGTVSRAAGQPPQTGTTDGRGADARFNLLHDVASNSQDDLLITDTANHSIRSLSNPDPFALSTVPLVGTVAGLPGTPGSADGTGTDARFSGPHGIAIGPGDVAYIADAGNHTIRRMTPEGVVTTLAGLAGQAGTVDGNGTHARFNMPTTIAVDRDGNVFVGQLSALRRITPSGDVTTIPNAPGSVEAVDAAGTLYLRSGGRIFAGTTAGTSPDAPAITSQPANAITGAGSTTPVSMTVSASGVPAPTYRWQRSNDGGATWSGVVDGSGISGSHTASLTFTGIAVSQSGRHYRAVVSNSFGSVTSASALLTVMSTTPASLTFGIERSSPHRVTPAQQITPRSASGATAWTASTDAAWLVADGSATNGAQTGAFMISVNAAAINFSTAPATQTATVTLVATNIGVSMTVPVTLRVHDPGSLPVLGQVDTPLQNATGVQGAIGVTGWAVHPLGISRIQVYRNCVVGFETCSGLGSGRSVVRLGDATFIPGARPDVEGAFPGYPAAHIGGWGMQILSNQLPRTTGTFAVSGGQGPITLYVLATSVNAIDDDFNSTILSRSWTDPACPATGIPCASIATTITLDNDAIAKPFGTIDTPASAATVSGIVANFGWALTPDSDTVAGPGDILIPTNGSTIAVFIDGVATAQVAYNQCRGTVGNPVPAGVHCNDDVASLFGNATPQPALGTRTSNPTRFRNLDAGRGAIGAFNIDTTLLSNGLHTIAWSVTDSEGRVEGIGSRYFEVSNGTADVARAASARRNTMEAPASIGPTVSGRTGFDLRRPWTMLHADVNGIRHVRIPVSNGRVELSLGTGIAAAYLEANGERRSLPAGAAFDAATGIFTWAPGPGYLGTYRFVFGEVTTDITLNTPAPTPAGESEIRMFLDHARVEGPVLSERSVRVEGWALDPQAEIGSGIATVHVWAIPRSNASPVFLGEASLDVARPDVAAAFGPAFGHAGFRLESTAALAPGEYDITAYVWNWRTARWEDARSARVTVR